MIIHTTDDAFWDGPAMPGCDSVGGLMLPGTCTTKGSAHTYGETVAALQDGQIWCNNFASHTGGPPDGLGGGPISGMADVSAGFFTPYMGMPTLADSTGGQAWEIKDVLAGMVSLSAAINKSIAANHCSPYPH
jgi:hypothetical protein